MDKEFIIITAMTLTAVFIIGCFVIIAVELIKVDTELELNEGYGITQDIGL